MKRVIMDEMPSGITSLSLKFVANWERLLNPGKVVAVTVSREESTLITRVEFAEVVLVTDGFEVGYGGEGPCGLKKLLEDHGIPFSDDTDPRYLHLGVGQTFTWPRVQEKSFTVGGIPTAHYDMSDQQADEFRGEGKGWGRR